MRETNASEPLMTHRKLLRRRQNRRRANLPGSAWKAAYLLSMWRPVWRRRDSHLGFRTELENLDGDAKGKSTSGENREAESTDAPARGGLLCSSDEAGVMPVERREQAIAIGLGSTGNGRNLMLNGMRQPSCDGTSRMMREHHVRFCEGLGVKSPGLLGHCCPTRMHRHVRSLRKLTFILKTEHGWESCPPRFSICAPS